MRQITPSLLSAQLAGKFMILENGLANGAIAISCKQGKTSEHRDIPGWTVGASKGPMPSQGLRSRRSSGEAAVMESLPDLSLSL